MKPPEESPMELSELLSYLARELDSLGVKYFVTGSMATIYFGEPRFTNDIDIVVELSLQNIAQLSAAFPDDDFYCSTPMIESAVKNRSQFNIIQPKTGLKIDVMVSDRSEFDQSRFSRRRQFEIEDNQTVWFSTPEDVILKKLIYYQEGGSEKHIRDILGVLKLQKESIDFDYLSHWAKQLDVLTLWQDVFARANSDTTDLP